MKADELREMAAVLLESQHAYATERCAYYEIGGNDVFVVRKFTGAVRGMYLSFEKLDDGRTVGWFNRDFYDLTNQAGEMAKNITKWEELMQC